MFNADGTINVTGMIKQAESSGGSTLPDGEYVCRLLSAEILDAKGEGKVPLPGKKRLAAKFTIMRGECEKQELFLAYNLFLNDKKDGSGPTVGSSSGTVRLITDLIAIGKPYVEGKGAKLALDEHKNMGLVTAKGVSVEALKKFWMERVVGELIVISSKTETSERPGQKAFSYPLRKFVGLLEDFEAVVESEDGNPADAPEAYNPEEEIPF